MTESELKLGIYEKALPKDWSWTEKLQSASHLGFQFVEMSIDESDERIHRLDWSAAERRAFREAVAGSGVTVPSICLSGHRRYPLGSHDAEVRATGLAILRKAIGLAVDLGVRTVQLAGYDVYYEPSDEATKGWFVEGLQRGIELAAREEVMLAMEVMDYPLMSSIVKFLNLERTLSSPWFAVYPDVGNLSAWGNDVLSELELGLNRIVAIHLKDTLAVKPGFPGKFRDVPFGSGCVDFTAIFRKLGALGYRGPFLIEMWSEQSANRQDAIDEIARVRQWILERMRSSGLLCDSVPTMSQLVSKGA